MFPMICDAMLLVWTRRWLRTSPGDIYAMLVRTMPCYAERHVNDVVLRHIAISRRRRLTIGDAFQRAIVTQCMSRRFDLASV